MSKVEHSESLFREAMSSAKNLSEKIEHLMKADNWDEEWDKIDALITERNQALDTAIVPSLPETLHEEARLALAQAKQQDKTLMNVARQRQKTNGEEQIKLKHGKKSIQSYLSGD